ncbi:hypothetical protein OV207_08505 [Corallococcus sp. BB11-1]|uniref:hypothetical protein n=1 Tax=Corallococcus sp. BB11-1 TaxID=2996783 RepID=UPI00226EA4F9|nr:hypothetical protein [Corallococcus sp. BB11-1]MCY1031493.1 hypothetical protein [Corallococcus sp. BB11-1]
MHTPARRWRGALCVAGLGLTLALPAQARAPLPPPPLFQLGPASPAITEARELLEAGRFQETLSVVQRGLDAPDVTDDELVELYRLQGLTALYVGDEPLARGAYEKLLQARPDFELPRSAPPKIRALFAKLKEDLKHRRVHPVTLEVDPIPDPAPGETVRVEATLRDMALGARARLFYRRAGAQAFSSVDFVRDRARPEHYSAVLPSYELPVESTSYEVEYYFEVVDAAQRRLAGRGDPFHPLLFQVAPRNAPTATLTEGQGRPWYKSPWVWVAVGAVAIGGTAGVVALTSSEDRGRVPLTIRVEDALP